MINKQKGDMYPFVTHTWNAIRGKCLHNCKYCYMKVFPIGELKLEEKELNSNLGKDKTIFVGSSTDMFATNVPDPWIVRTLQHCSKFSDNQYLFQSKNPARMFSFIHLFPPNYIFGTTIETNRDYKMSDAPTTENRANFMIRTTLKEKMVTIEPILDFDLDIMVDWMKRIKPKWINIGADSKGHKLPEPSKEKTNQLINELEKITEIKLKRNIHRIRK